MRVELAHEDRQTPVEHSAVAPPAVAEAGRDALLLQLLRLLQPPGQHITSTRS